MSLRNDDLPENVNNLVYETGSVRTVSRDDCLWTNEKHFLGRFVTRSFYSKLTIINRNNFCKLTIKSSIW